MKYKHVCLDKEEQIEAEAWIQKHGLEHVVEEDGAIGGRFSINFTLTSIGTMVSVNCLCGANKYIHRDL